MAKKRLKYVFGGKRLLAGGDTDPVDAGLTMGKGVSALNWATLPNEGLPEKSPGSPINWDAIVGKAGKIADAAVPYASNIANAFRRPPMPSVPNLVAPVTLSRIHLDAARQQATSAARAQDINADRSLDEQSAAAVRSSNLAKSLNQQGQISEQEAFLNARQKAEAAGMNLNVDAMNTAALNKMGDEKVQRGIAIQREQSQNISNAADKYIGMENEHAKAELDKQKLQTLSQIWKESGVYDRMMKRMKDQGIKDPTGIEKYLGTELENHAMGGTLRKVFDMGGPGDRGALATDVNRTLTSGNIPRGPQLAAYSPQERDLLQNAFIWSNRSDMMGKNPEQRISSYYGQPVTNAPMDMMRQGLQNLGTGPIANYWNSSDKMLRARQGDPEGATASMTATAMHQGAPLAFGGYRAGMGRGYTNPFGNTRTIGLGPGIPKDKFNPHHISHQQHNLLAAGGSMQGPWDEEYAMGGLKPKLVDHSMWREPYKEWALTSNTPNFAMGGEFSHETTAEDLDHWNSKDFDKMKTGGWISKAVNPAHKGYCTPLSKATCTPKRKAFAMTMKKHHGFHAMGGSLKPVY